MLNLFNKKYKAVSNIFVHTVEDKKYTFPAPISIYANIGNEQNGGCNEIHFKFSNYLDSFLPLSFHFSVFMFLLSHDYRIDAIYIEGLNKKEDTTEVSGYGATFNFLDTKLLVNLGEDEIYDDYCKKIKAFRSS